MNEKEVLPTRRAWVFWEGSVKSFAIPLKMSGPHVYGNERPANPGWRMGEVFFWESDVK
jgi:hypothetical protein